MEYRIDLNALAEFISRQVEQIEAASIPKLLADVVELRLRHEAVSRDEVAASIARRASAVGTPLTPAAGL